MNNPFESHIGATGAARRPPVVWDAPAELVLDGQGVVRDCNGAGAALFGQERDAMLWQHVSRLFPQLESMPLMQDGELSARFRFLCSIGCGFQSVRADGERFVSELFLNELGNPGSRHVRVIVRPL